MIIPYVSDGRAILVQDKRTNEWGFICGGVKREEKYIEAAVRELNEETSGLLTDIPGFYRRVEFSTLYRPTELLKVDKKQNVKIKSIYHIYMFKVPDDIDLSKFKSNSEIKQIKLQHYESIPNTWELCDFVFSKII
tara:strand:+ start:162 stop:569 length:408 start_codon:yes stop_codon:yes gene_type:complete